MMKLPTASLPSLLCPRPAPASTLALALRRCCWRPPLAARPPQCLTRPLAATARRSLFSRRDPNEGAAAADDDDDDGASSPDDAHTDADADNNIISPRVYILGLGNLGAFIAHSLRTLPRPPPVTLLLHSEEQYQGWKLNQRRITVHSHGLAEHSRGYDVSVLRDGRWYTMLQPPPSASEASTGGSKPRHDGGYDSSSNDDPDGGGVATSHAMKDMQIPDTAQIDNLIVTVKTTQIRRAMESVRARLAPRSTILLLQNGLGVKEELDAIVFPNADARPNYLSGAVSHGLSAVRPFEVVHAGAGPIKLGLVHTNRTLLARARATRADLNLRGEDEAILYNEHDQWARKPSALFMPSSARYLLRLTTSAPRLLASTLSKPALLQAQLEKLVANCLINPLSVVFDCPNGDLLYNNHVSRIQRLLLFEICSVITAMPELQSVPGLHARFGPERLRTIAIALMKQTAENSSSMLQDARADKETEIHYMNGYIVRKGEQLGMKCVANYLLVQMVLGKTRSQSKKMAGQIPFDQL